MSGRRARAERRRILLITPDPDNAPDGLVNAARIRHDANVNGRCPVCGATFDLDELAPGIYQGTMRHSDNCPCLRDGEAA